MAGLLLEIVLDERDFQGLLTIPTVSTALDEALAATDLGEVAGHSRDGGWISFDVELDEEGRLTESLVVIRRVLRGLGLPPNAPIYRWEEVGAGPDLAASTAKIDPTWSSHARYQPDYDRGRVAS
jgi:hypothetical protein